MRAWSSALLIVVAVGACVRGRASLIEDEETKVECDTGLSSCGGECVDTELDPFHCGACSKLCASGELCSVGICASGCMGGTLECGATCVDPQTSNEHCGDCDNTCVLPQVCNAGGCVAECAPPNEDCDGTCIDTQADAANCGGCGAACAMGESCTAGECYPRDCATLLANDNALPDGSYTIDPDGGGGQAPMSVTCNMTTDSGGWIALSIDDSDNIVMSENAVDNPWNKCADDSAAHFDGIDATAITPDSTGVVEFIAQLNYLNPTDMAVYTPAQMDAIRAVVSELSVTTRMVAVTTDNDLNDWQTDMMGGHEVYIMGAAMTWNLLTPGSGPDCGGGAGSFPAAGSQSEFYLWHQTAMSSVVDGVTGLMDSDLTGIGVGDIIPHQVRLIVDSGGGCAFGYEKPVFLVR